MTHSRLLLNISLEEEQFVAARQLLIETNLLECYVSEKEVDAPVTYVLHEPLNIDQFMIQVKLVDRLKSSVGEIEFGRLSYLSAKLGVPSGYKSLDQFQDLSNIASKQTISPLVSNALVVNKISIRHANPFTLPLSEIEFIETIEDYAMMNAEKFINQRARLQPNPEVSTLLAELRDSSMAMKDEVICCLIDYALFRCNGFLRIVYVQKVAQSLMAVKANSAADALRFFRALSFRKQERNEQPQTIKPKVNRPNASTSTYRQPSLIEEEHIPD
ncbi:unnamed protein product [Didymodactylos carnosus]|uniref:Uncharacterized protein n=1 Tax=Didymodactylos carnosus TaxID=1234261 RepID=A0A8S2GCG6_9BILA|nr:unnamed protein product [Didymodactylos carnosus]CAF3491943.1 unnamed protein product [Didymodactylos carnosus]